MHEKLSSFITINAKSKADFEYPFLPVFAELSGNDDKSRLRNSSS